MRLSAKMRMVLLAAGFAGLAYAPPAPAAQGALLASYGIYIAGLPIGRADALSHFRGASYALTINGSTSGLSRLVSDGTAEMRSAGSIYGARLYSGTYELDTQESGLATQVRMRLNSGSVVSVTAAPRLQPSRDRVPVTGTHLRDVVDPISAFIVPMASANTDGRSACERTIRVFDGWQRFDIRLHFKEARTVDEDVGPASRSMFVCGARFVPVAGHIPDSDGVKFMAMNQNIEVWLTPVGGVDVLIPYRIQVGTLIGNLTIKALSISKQDGLDRAAIQ